MKPKIIVIGGANATTLQIMRCTYFGMHKKAILILIASTENIFSKAVIHSNSVKEFHIVESENEAISFLENSFSEEKEKPILLTSTDSIVECFAEYSQELSQKYIIPYVKGIDKGLLRLLNKEYMSNLARESGLLVPESYSEEERLPETAFPCIIKPLESAKGGKSITVCLTQNEYHKQIEKYHSKGIPIQVQKFIEKDLEICILGISTFRSNEILLSGVIRKIRESCGCTSFAKLEKDIERYLDPEIIRSFIRKTQYVGLFSIELLIQKNQVFFLEVNFRADANLLAFAAGGCNFVEILYKDVIGEKIPETTISKELYCMDERTDSWNMRNGSVPIFQWLWDYFRTNCHYIFYSKDYFIAFQMFLYMLKKFLFKQKIKS